MFKFYKWKVEQAKKDPRIRKQINSKELEELYNKNNLTALEEKKMMELEVEIEKSKEENMKNNNCHWWEGEDVFYEAL